MKKYIPYILTVLLAAAIIVLFITGDSKKENRKLDERITLRKKDKIPYGTFVAFNSLKQLFPGAELSTNHYEPGYWDNLSAYDTKQVLMVVTGKFNADEREMRRLIEFTEKGNDVFISAMYISSAADKLLKCSSSAIDLSYFTTEDLAENIQLSLADEPFGLGLKYKYPGRTFSSYFTTIDSATTDVLGYDQSKRPDFIHLKAGKGNFFVHLEPLAFSNYFLLHKNNIDYFEKIISLMQPDAKKVVWDEYYLAKRDKPQKKQGWMAVLFRYPALRAALLTAIIALLIYVLMEMRRKQRPVPVIRKPKNESLDFVKTIGRLYYDKGDNRNLCTKMSAYFLEHVRNKYKLPTSVLDDEFVNNLHYKSGVEKEEVRQIISSIQYFEKANVVSNEQLTNFHNQVESFYKKA